MDLALGSIERNLTEADARTMPASIRRNRQGDRTNCREAADAARSQAPVRTICPRRGAAPRRVAGLIVNFVRRSHNEESRRGWNGSNSPLLFGSPPAREVK
ncbi:hypothetical protein [Kaistia soli]|uniref:hypothetical protein n=1 Tax=Kaistia soli TaxID=446684 RepID=UPI0015881044|nr:hypothetical protein [Kaistia soli]